MNILVITQYYFPEQFKITDICEGLVKKGHLVTVVTGQPNYPSGKIYDGYKNLACNYCINGVNVIRTKIRPRKSGSLNLFLNYLSFWKNSIKAVKKLDGVYDAIYVWEISPIFYLHAANVYKKKFNKKIFCYCMDLWPESLKVGGLSEKSIIYKIIGHISKKLYNNCDEIIVSSPSFTEYLINVINYKGVIKYIPQHYSKKFELNNKKKDNKIIFMYAGNIGKAQKIENIIDSFYNTNAELWIYGNGSKFLDCLNLINEKNISNVKMFGMVKQEELVNAYSNCDFCVLPLVSDSFVGKTIPAKLQEYLSFGKPILGAIHGDSELIIRELDCGVICDIEDVSDLKQGIKKMIDNYDYYQHNSEKEINYYTNNFTLDIYLERILKEMEELK